MIGQLVVILVILDDYFRFVKPCRSGISGISELIHPKSSIKKLACAVTQMS